MISTEKRNTYWVISTITIVIAILVLCAFVMIYIDPAFHYHAPLEKIKYPLEQERYLNDGIVRNFEYDSIITGTSMTENFKTSEADKIFDADFVKVPFAGSYYKEVADNLRRAYGSGKNIRYVIQSLDYSAPIWDKDTYRSKFDYPTYLYNDNLIDDVNYVLNKDMLLRAGLDILHTVTSADSGAYSFDDYVNWNDHFDFGSEAVLKSYTLEKKANVERVFTQDERDMILENIRQNITSLAQEHLETTFYLFIPPYSICFWDILNNDGELDWYIDEEKVVIQEILCHSNIKLYSFRNNFEIICDLDNYKDETHYGEWINSQILEWMADGDYLLTKDNYLEYIETIREFYNSYDYASIHK